MKGIFLELLVMMHCKSSKLCILLTCLLILPVTLNQFEISYAQDPVFDPNEYDPVENPAPEEDDREDDDTRDEESNSDTNDTLSDGAFDDFGTTDGFDTTYDYGTTDEFSTPGFSSDEFSTPGFSSDEFSTFGSPNTTELVTSLSNNIGDSINGKMLVSGGKVYVIWEDKTETGSDLFFTRSDDGSIYSPKKKVNTGSGTSSNPSLAISGNTVQVVWDQVTDTGGHEIMFSRSFDNGDKFEEQKKVGTSSTQLNPKIIAPNNETYIVWSQTTGLDASDIFFVTSLDGDEFTEPVNISNNNGESVNPQIFSSGESVYVIWNDNTYDGNNEILFWKKDVNDTAFKPPTNLSNNIGESLNPEMLTDGTNIYVVWEDSTPSNQSNHDILFAKSNNKGENFSGFVNLSNNTGESLNPVVTGSGSNVYVAWKDSSSGNNDIFFARSTNRGDNFGNYTNISNTMTDSYDQRLISSGTYVYVVWSDAAVGNTDILFIKSNNNGDTFGKIKNLSNNEEESNFAQLSLIGDREIVLWRDDTLSNKGEIMITDKISNAVDFTGANDLISGFESDSQSISEFASGNQIGSQFGPTGEIPESQLGPTGEIPENELEPSDEIPEWEFGK